MPELPEVETIKSQLSKDIAGKKILDVEILLPKIVKVPKQKFKWATVGARIKKIARRAKILIFELDNGWSFLMHLKLTGQLIFNGQKNKHTHVIFRFSDRSHLLFNDLRQFGYIKLVKTADLPGFLEKEKLGPEPLNKDFTLEDFQAILAKKPKTKIKQFLMDPKNIAGIGNIYSDEILFEAGVLPGHPAENLTPSEIKKIFDAAKHILAWAVKLRGTSASDYLDAHGQKGKFLAQLKVYGREGENCVKCEGKIQRLKMNGRSAHFCPICQK